MPRTKQKPRIGIEQIRKRYAHYGDTDSLSCNDCAVLHVRFLLEEIDKLETERNGIQIGNGNKQTNIFR